MCRQRLLTGVRERGGGAIRRRRRSANRLQSARSLMSVAGTNEYRYITASYSAYVAVQLINNHVWCSIHTFMPHPISMFMCPFSRSYSRSACKLEFAYNSFLVFRKGVGRWIRASCQTLIYIVVGQLPKRELVVEIFAVKYNGATLKC